MEEFIVKIKRLELDAKIPNYAYEGDAGFDLFAMEPVVLSPGERKMIRTGIAMEIPHGFVGLIWDKGSVSMKYGLKTLGGVVDSGFRGEIKVGLVNLSGEDYKIEKHDKVAQMIVQEFEHAQIEEAEDLGKSERGEKGFGSSGKNFAEENKNIEA
ncbi:MAG TPA: dUTP diphosphatase [Candidatus Paceibacterota bacterium]|nr:dUTP diphosphatase [Candidatus Paceibacterota bacterium]